jgi:hypothetical protein
MKTSTQPTETETRYHRTLKTTVRLQAVRSTDVAQDAGAIVRYATLAFGVAS